MSKWFQWVVLTSITRSPLLSILLLLVFWWVADRFTLRLLPNPVRLFMRWQRGERLERMLLANPHDRRARFELADIRLEQRRYRAAMDVLRPNLEAGDEDARTLYLMGVALFGAGYPEQAEELMAAVLEQDPGFRLGAAHLEQGRWRLARGDFQGARTALEALLTKRRGTVEGRVLLAQALERAGDRAAAVRMREEAWREYVSAPSHQRRAERFWAWRARPSRPLTYAVAALTVGLLLSGFLAPSVAGWVAQAGFGTSEPQQGEAHRVTSALAQQHSDAAALGAALERIGTWLKTNEPWAAEALQPGLSDAEIDRKLSGAGFPYALPGEVRQLYRWRNGMREHPGPDGVPGDFIWYHRLLSLDEALAARRRDGALYGMPDNWLPLFSFEQEYYYVLCGNEEVSAVPVHHRLLEDSSTLAFTNLTRMMVTGAEWHEQHAVDKERGSTRKLADIHRKHNPGATFPFAVAP